MPLTNSELLRLDASAGLSFRELADTEPKLAAKLTPVLDERLTAAVGEMISRSEKLRDAAGDLGAITLPDDLSTPVAQVTVDVLRDAIGEKAIAEDPALQEAIATLESDIDVGVRVADAVGVDEPLRTVPGLGADLSRARVHAFADAVGLPAKTATALGGLGSLTAVTETNLAALVDAGTLTATAARNAGTAVALYDLFDERQELIQAFAAEAADPVALTSLPADQWKKRIVASGTIPLGGMSEDDYAGLLRARIDERFRTSAIARDLTAARIPAVLDANVELDALRADDRNARVVGRDFGDLSIGRMPAARRKKLREAHEQVTTLHRRYRGLGIGELLDDTTSPAADRVTEAGRRIDQANAFLTANPGALEMNLLPGSDDAANLRFPRGTSQDDRKRLLAFGRGYQRALAVTDDLPTAQAMVDAGLGSAISIMRHTPDRIAALTGFDADRIARLIDRAEGVAIATGSGVATILDAGSGGFTDLAVNNVLPDVGDFLKELPGYEDFFGAQELCDCSHCRSMLSPAAYFVDLMRFIDEKVTRPVFGQRQSHDLMLRTRRPDLWDRLELTCENTNQEIPSLVIVNEVLEDAVSRDVQPGGDLTDRARVRGRVYGQELSVKTHSFKQPFHLPFTELATYIRHFDRSLADLAEAGAAVGTPLARLRLVLPPEDHRLITTPDVTVAVLSRLYGIDFAQGTDPVDVQDLLSPIGVERDELGDLLDVRFVRERAAITIRSEKRDAASVQNDIERVRGLTLGALDRLHRFVRLWRATGWRTGELDIVRTRLEQSGEGTGLDGGIVAAVAHLRRIGESWDMPVEELVSLCADIPDVPAAGARPRPPGSRRDHAAAPARVPLLDRLFNRPADVEADGAYPNAGATFTHPMLAIGAPVPSPVLPRLLAGLSVDEGGLHHLIRGLAIPLGVDLTSAVAADRAFPLTLRNLSLLYRHARLARVLGIAVPELFALAALAPGIPLGYVETLADLDALVRAARWVTSSRWSIAALVEACAPGTPAIVVSRAAVGATAAGTQVGYDVERYGRALPRETVTLAANTTLTAVVADWNAQAQSTVAYRADATGAAAPDGDRLAIRTLTPGAGARITITADAAALFAQNPPVSAAGSDVVVPAQGGVPSIAAADLARQVVDEVNATGALTFADTLFTTIAPFAPRVTSPAAVAAAAAGDTVTYTAVRRGQVGVTETVTFADDSDLDAVVADWNGQVTATVAFRSDATGTASAAGAYLSVRLSDGDGDDSRIDITADSANILTAAGTASVRGLTITEERSRAVITANLARLEPVGRDGAHRLRGDWDPSAPVATGGLDASVEPTLRAVFNGFHGGAVLLGALPGKLAAGPAAVARAVDLLGIDLADAPLFGELRDPTLDPVEIASVITRLHRFERVLTVARVGDAPMLDVLKNQRAWFGIDDFDHIGLASIRRLDLFRNLIDPWIQREEDPPDLAAAIAGYVAGTGFAAGDLATVATLVGSDEALVASLRTELPQPAEPFAALEQVILASLVCRQVGAPAVLLRLIQSARFDELTSASALLAGALRARYPDPADFESNHEPYRDIVLSRQRDGLVAYLLHSRTTYPFDEVSDLYHHYLLDPLVEGVVRTSRVAAGIAGAQLYVQRCLMNLEETAQGHTDPLRVSPSRIPRAEWDWRQNYRVWEANRKVFLFPESYLEPELRDDKTPLFKQLEEELLAKPVTEEAVREAYSRYLRGFDELAGLRIAGSYHERNEGARRDVLHLFGTTGDDPPVYYYRRVDDAHFGVGATDRATRWGPWQRLDLQIPTRTVSPLVHNGQLYVFWVRYVTRSVNQIVNGTSRFAGYSHRAHVEFSTRRLDGTWTPAQPVELTEEPFVTSGNGIILDPLVPRDATKLELPYVGSLMLYSNYQPLYDRVAHDQPKDDYTLRGFGWDRIYPGSGDRIELRGINFQMWSRLDLYTRQIGRRINYDDVNPPGPLMNRGVPWFPPEAIEGIAVVIALISLFGGSLSESQKILKGILQSAKQDLFWSQVTGDRRTLHAITMGTGEYAVFDRYTFASLLLERERLERYEQRLAVTGPPEWTAPQWHPDVTGYLKRFFRPNPVLSMPAAATVGVVNGAYADVIVQNGREMFHVGKRTVEGKPYVLRRLSTGVSEQVATILHNEGLDALLATSRQQQVNEPGHPFSNLGAGLADRSRSGTLDFDGPMGTYLREIYFHIPFLLADHLNSQGEFEAAQRWYHHVFDPTSSEVIGGIPAGIPDAERRRRELDRVWRYRELRRLDAQALRQQLVNAPALDAYRRDPFNPHAIARLRLTAYQKSLVMRYIDNLLDWGDHLFALAYSQGNPEHLREATLKYLLAQDLLGKRPYRGGACGDGVATSRRLADILATMADDADEFLVELESLIVTYTGFPAQTTTGFMPLWHAATSDTSTAGGGAQGSAGAYAERAMGRALTQNDLDAPPPALIEQMASIRHVDLSAFAELADGATDAPVSAPAEAVTGLVADVRVVIPAFVWEVERNALFCLPANEKLGGYWDRVEDRLFKVRNALDPDGNFRPLPLFSAPIDPGLLVRAKAAGLGVEDALGQSAGTVPPFRFSYLIERARTQAATLQQFGSALLSAHERRDGEDLAALRNTHERNLHRLTLETRRTELTAAAVGLEQATRQQESARYRYEHAAELIATGLTAPELAQTAFRATATVLRGADAILKLAAGIGYLVPELGSPFAMKYGGKQLGDSFDAIAQSIASTATVAELAADVSGTVAGFERREEGWRHDLRLAENELKVLDRDVRSAELRRDLAQRALDQQALTARQHDEVMDLYRDKFTGLGLYTHMARALQQLHRQAYGNALAVARLAEQAYHFELPGDDATYVGGEWDGARSGLLAGERLTLALATLERRYLERYEDLPTQIPQTFSLKAIDPAALIELRETGSCEMRIPEFEFDLQYPGDYRRQIRAVQITIPSVRGPYTNVSATLTLLGSRIRTEPVTGAAALSDVPVTRTARIATSSAQSDSGRFELNFSGPLNNPFEGAGAISDWRIELPRLLRPFDYGTISDVGMTISYTARYDGVLRDAIEDPAGAGGLIASLAQTPLKRAFSLSRDFPAAFERLLGSPAGTPVDVTIDDRHLPLFVSDLQVTLASAELVLEITDGPVGAFAVDLNGTTVDGFPEIPDPRPAGAPVGGLPAKRAEAALAGGILGEHTLSISAFGGLAAAGGAAGIDRARLRDIILLVSYIAQP